MPITLSPRPHRVSVGSFTAQLYPLLGFPADFIELENLQSVTIKGDGYFSSVAVEQHDAYELLRSFFEDVGEELRTLEILRRNFGELTVIFLP